MKKQLLFVFATAALCFGVNAQTQPANSGFEGDWVDCVPYSYNGNNLTTKAQGTQPEGWIISNVIGMNGTGATTVGSVAEGYESEKAVKLTNSSNSLMKSQKVPAYLSLGTTWSTAQVSYLMRISNSDGGVFGGVEFTDRPTGMEFMYKRSRDAGNPNETTTVVAYLWKGHWIQESVPVNISLGSAPTKATMTDRDRCVLGMDMTGCQGGTVTKTDDAELIAVLRAEITEDADEWTKFTGTFEYMSDAAPEMMNIIIAAGDYFGGASEVGEGNSLTVDNVVFTYDEEPAPEPVDADIYPGTLTIEMMGGMLTEEPMEAQLQIAYNDDLNECTITLPDFTLDLGGGATNMGDIVVENVEVVASAASASYKGHVSGFTLLDGELECDIDLDGTINGQGEAVFNINVIWNGIPIAVVFNGNGKPAPGTTRIELVEAEQNAPAEYFNLQGQRVAAEQAAPGIYIVKRGNRTSKVVVR